MKLLTGVESLTKPVEIDDSSSSTTVFVRYNIEEQTKVDPVFKTESVVYVYDEKQYTFAEWNKIITDEIKEKDIQMKNDVDIIQTALAEILDLIDSLFYKPLTMSLDNDEDTDFMATTGIPADASFDAITKLYIALINKNIITLEKVPDMFKEKVEQYLETEKE